MRHPIHPFTLKGRTIAVGGSRLLIKLASEATDNRLSVTEYELPPGFPGPPPHKHKVFEHTWYVLDGELTVQLGEESSVLTRGSFIFIPKQMVHAFSNPGDAPTRVLVIDTPGGFEHYYDDLQAAFGEGQAIDQELIRGHPSTPDSGALTPVCRFETVIKHVLSEIFRTFVPPVQMMLIRRDAQTSCPSSKNTRFLIIN